MTLAELRAILSGAVLDDVLVAGFIDNDAMPARFRLIRAAVYFEIDSKLLTFETIRTTGRMRLTCIKSVGEFPCFDDDMLAALTSVREDLLDDALGVSRLVEFRLWGATEEQGELTCGAAQLGLSNGQVIFLDPTYHFGIRIGGERQRQLWLEGWPGASSQDEAVVRCASPK